jgi:large subunit ribosomal protein L17
MATSLFKHERIISTITKAKAAQRYAEKLITRGKVDSVHNRRIASARLFDEGVVSKLFTDIGVRMKDRAGGYTRILKLGKRYGDGAEMALLELVDYKLEVEDKDKKGKDKADKKEKGEAKAADTKKADNKAKEEKA